MWPEDPFFNLEMVMSDEDLKPQKSTVDTSPTFATDTHV